MIVMVVMIVSSGADRGDDYDYSNAADHGDGQVVMMTSVFTKS